MSDGYNYIVNKMMRSFTFGFRERRKSTPETIHFEPGTVHKYPAEKIAKMMKIKRIKRMIDIGKLAVSKKKPEEPRNA